MILLTKKTLKAVKKGTRANLREKAKISHTFHANFSKSDRAPPDLLARFLIPPSRQDKRMSAPGLSREIVNSATNVR